MLTSRAPAMEHIEHCMTEVSTQHRYRKPLGSELEEVVRSQGRTLVRDGEWRGVAKRGVCMNVYVHDYKPR